LAEGRSIAVAREASRLVDAIDREIARLGGRRPGNSKQLTQAESQVAQMPAVGPRNEDIVAALNISAQNRRGTPGTVLDNDGYRSPSTRRGGHHVRGMARHAQRDADP
jgi:hypothetical protein